MSAVKRWSVELVGERFDLEEFPLWTSGSETPVVQEGESFYLRVPVGLVGPEPDKVRPYALATLELLNGVGHLLNPSFRPLALSTKTLGLDHEGNVVSTSIEISGAEIRLKGGLLVASVSGVPHVDPRAGSAKPLLTAAETSGRARDALLILGRPNLTWAELYLLFELVEGDVGGKMFKRGWIAESDAKLLCHTANSYSALRSVGRHGKDRGNPPPSPMPRNTALGLVRELVLAWLRDLAKLNDGAE